MDRRAFFKLPLFGAIAAAGIAPTRAALVPPFFTYCVVAIGGQVSEIRDGRLVNTRWVATGTGFFYGRLSRPDPDLAKRQYDVYLVTAKHVLDEWKAQQAAGITKGQLLSELMVRVNPIDVTARATDVAITEFKDKDASWTNNPDGKDVSVIPVDIDALRKKAFGVTFFADDEMAADVSKLNNLKVSAGDGIFVLGFPMGIVGDWRNAVIIKSGVIARIEDMLLSRSDAFLIDALVFPGNSGGPVVLRPEITSIGGTPSQNRSYLIGMVVAYQPYIDVAVSQQTQHPRVTFEENSGLASVLPTDYIAAAIAADQKKHPPMLTPAPAPPRVEGTSPQPAPTPSEK
ncbi:trypsin-like peptidase domain-containing protein [Bradyrhizobium manausense]|uniref:trypsin-like peptidase domain-containing protein n=1 Tax=Bradyrhizobium manausense TaxID=989370 RepID=UPI001BA96B5A|nr:trypsin-like peptidase domain-containing protein [Bradyrhizobium manausense]MBR0725122.1 trypsin-like peptidase domain-containing protein [Bradyrhizobium manausense]